jgi:hypothetical protein
MTGKRCSVLRSWRPRQERSKGEASATSPTARGPEGGRVEKQPRLSKVEPCADCADSKRRHLVGLRHLPPWRSSLESVASRKTASPHSVETVRRWALPQHSSSSTRPAPESPLHCRPLTEHFLLLRLRGSPSTLSLSHWRRAPSASQYPQATSAIRDLAPAPNHRILALYWSPSSSAETLLFSDTGRASFSRS